MTLAEVINQALGKILVLDVGQTPSTEDYTTGRNAVNAMLEQWSITKPMVGSYVTETFALVASTATYTIGASGLFVTIRPVKITDAGILDSAGVRHPMRIVGRSEYRSISDLTAIGAVPKILYDDYAYPLSTLHVYPKPTATPSLVITSWKQLASFTLVNGAAITALTAGNPTICTSNAHGLLTGDGVTISGATGGTPGDWTAINASWAVTRVNVNQFSVPISTVSATGAIGAPVFSTAVVLAPGLLEAIIYNLAVRLASDYSRPVPPEVAAIAGTSRQAIGELNAMNENAVNDLPQAPMQPGVAQ